MSKKPYDTLTDNALKIAIIRNASPLLLKQIKREADQRLVTHASCSAIVRRTKNTLRHVNIALSKLNKGRK